MKPFIKTLFPALLIALISCEKELDYKDLDYKPKIVLNGLIYQDSIVTLNVSRTKSIMEADSILPFLDNAEVKLFENDVFIETLTYDSLGYYHSVNTTKTNKKYRIEAKTKDIEKAIATFGFDQPIDFNLNNIKYSIHDTTVSIDEPVKKDSNIFLVQMNFDMVFNDNGNEENFYDFGCFGNFIRYSINSEYDENNNHTETIHLSQTNREYLRFTTHTDNRRYYPDGISSYNGYELNHYITDDLFNGQAINFKLATGFYTSRNYPVEIVLFSYPFDYIFFHKTGYQYINNWGNSFSQPMNIHSNVENGLGIVCAVTTYKETIALLFP